MNRREFIRNGGLLGAGAALFAGQATAKAAAPSADAESLTFCLFADIHYYPGVFPHDTHEWLRRILNRALKEKAEFVIHLGDFTHRNQDAEAYIKMYNDFSLPTYHTIGNHENDGRNYEQVLRAYHMKCGYYFFDKKGFRFVVLDPNYFKLGDQFIHYANGNYFKALREGAYGPALPPDQVQWLKETVQASPYPCILMSHQSFERETDGVKNYQEVRDLINETNRRHPGRIPLVMNGHYHCDHLRILDGVIYFDVNSANYQWVNKPHNLYPEEVTKNHSLAKNTVMFNDPVSAIVTLTHDGGIRIKGQKSSLFMGVTREMTGNPRFDSMGRETTAVIQSIDLKLNHC